MKILENGVHSALKSRRCITKAKWHDGILESAPTRLIRSSLAVFGENEDMMEATAQIHFGEDTGLTHVVQALVNPGHRIHHLFGDVVQPPVINAHSIRTIVLLRKQNASTESGMRSQTMRKILVQLMTKLHFLRRSIPKNAVTGWNRIRDQVHAVIGRP